MRRDEAGARGGAAAPATAPAGGEGAEAGAALAVVPMLMIRGRGTAGEGARRAGEGASGRRGVQKRAGGDDGRGAGERARRPRD